jgi:hypothetical protein
MSDPIERKLLREIRDYSATPYFELRVLQISVDDGGVEGAREATATNRTL